MFSDDLTDAVLEETEISDELLYSAIRSGALTRELTPVLMGSAYKNKGVQPLLGRDVEAVVWPNGRPDLYFIRRIVAKAERAIGSIDRVDFFIILAGQVNHVTTQDRVMVVT